MISEMMYSTNICSMVADYMKKAKVGMLFQKLLSFFIGHTTLQSKNKVLIIVLK